MLLKVLTGLHVAILSVLSTDNKHDVAGQLLAEAHP